MIKHFKKRRNQADNTSHLSRKTTAWRWHSHKFRVLTMIYNR